MKTVSGTKHQNKLMEKCKQVYRNYGYNHEQDFPGEYYFMHNTRTDEKVRLYYNGRVIEGDLVVDFITRREK